MPIHGVNYLLLLVLQSLMTGLMYNRPENHIAYLQDCLKTLESEKGDEPVPWNRFIVASKPLPAIPSENKDDCCSDSREIVSSGYTTDSCHTSGASFFYFATEIL